MSSSNFILLSAHYCADVRLHSRLCSLIASTQVGAFTQGIIMTLVAFPNLIYRADHMPRLTCMTCGGMMFLSLIEPVSEGFEIESFSCAECDVPEEFVVEL